MKNKRRNPWKELDRRIKKLSKKEKISKSTIFEWGDVADAMGAQLPLISHRYLPSPIIHCKLINRILKIIGISTSASRAAIAIETNLRVLAASRSLGNPLDTTSAERFGILKEKLKPFIGKDGKTYVTVYNGGDPKSPTSYKTNMI